MIKNSKEMPQKISIRSSKHAKAAYHKHQGQKLHETEHHDRMGHEVGSDEAFPGNGENA